MSDDSPMKTYWEALKASGMEPESPSDVQKLVQLLDS